MALSSMALVAAAAVATDFWHGWTSTEEDLGGGRTRITVSDPNGTVQFDGTVEAGEGLFMTEDHEFMVLVPTTDDEAIDAVLAEEAGRD